MKPISLQIGTSIVLAALAGCGAQPAKEPTPPDTKPAASATNDPETIKASLAKLNPEDRKLAEQQQYCAVENKNLLGFMGMPYKLTIQDETVFLCCDGCESRAKAHADRTIARVRQLREKNGAAPNK